MFDVKIIAHSESLEGKELVTYQLQYPRFIHAEVMTHRVFSRNAMSSRAVPVKVMLEQVRKHPAAPIKWGANQAGMQAADELPPNKRDAAIASWNRAAQHAAYFAEELHALGLHKQHANRLLEPFQWMRTIVSATEWQHFYDLRCHPDAQPEFQLLANMMRTAHKASSPVVRDPNDIQQAWHLPYISEDERASIHVASDAVVLAKVCAARCERVSYLKHDGTSPTLTEDLALFNRLAGSIPIHASPLEHAAMATEHADTTFGNFKGWMQLRQLHENQLHTTTDAHTNQAA